MIRRPPRSTLSSSSAASDVYKRQLHHPISFKNMRIIQMPQHLHPHTFAQSPQPFLPFPSPHQYYHQMAPSPAPLHQPYLISHPHWNPPVSYTHLTLPTT